MNGNHLVVKENTGAPAANEPYTLQLRDTPLMGTYWRICGLCFLGIAARAMADTPLNGLFLVPINAPLELNADAIGTLGATPEARILKIPTVFATVAIGAGPSNHWAFTWNGAGDVFVPAGWTIRGMVNVLPGTANPGPGLVAGYQNRVSALVQVCREQP